MSRSDQQLREDALAIWRAGVNAVRSDELIRRSVRVHGHRLEFGDGELEIDLQSLRRIIVVGAGKAGAGMAAGVEAALGESLCAEKQLSGWVNVPADCVRPLHRIHLHAARPAGVNEPTEAGVEGTRQILQLVEQAGSDDLCLCLLSGGGSALLPAPLDGITLADKQAVTNHLSGAGANIEQLNTVRKQLSRIKGGGLARACRAGRLVTLIISDVLGDPLDVIASGPTVLNRTGPQDALDVLQQFHAREAGIREEVFRRLEQSVRQAESLEPPQCRVTNLVIGNNAVAVDAAGVEAERRGYSHAMIASREMEGAAEGVGRHLAAMALQMRGSAGPDCLITGGEPVVQLVDTARRGLGGRNQQLVLAALDYLLEHEPRSRPLDHMVLLSGGTDGEDGPTDAAGALIDAGVAAAVADQRERVREALERNDAYHFFDPLDALLRTGPTHTNVCDIRVLVVGQS